jgi:hypothetical protein
MKKTLLLAGALICAGVIAGCSTATSKRLNQLELGMTQAQVKKILGNEYVVKASKTEANGSVLQMWEYRDSKTEEAYRIFFKDGTLAQWGTQGRMDFPDLHVPGGK